MYSTIVCERHHLYSYAQTWMIPVQCAIIINQSIPYYLQMYDQNRNLIQAYSPDSDVELKLCIVICDKGVEKMVDLKSLSERAMRHRRRQRLEQSIDEFYSYISPKIMRTLQMHQSPILKDVINNYKFVSILNNLDRASERRLSVLRRGHGLRRALFISDRITYEI
jgi:hypothetical protein